MAASTETNNQQDPKDDWVLITNGEGFSFMIKRGIANASGTLRNMLSVESNFREAVSNICEINERGVVVEKLCEYLAYKAHYGKAPPREEIPDFVERIPPEIALELLVTADYYDV